MADKTFLFINPNSHTVQLVGPDKQLIKVESKQKITLTEHFLKYCPKYLRVADQAKPELRKKNTKVSRPQTSAPKKKRDDIHVPTVAHKRVNKDGIRNRILKRSNNKVVGRKISNTHALKIFKNFMERDTINISNGIGIGIDFDHDLDSLKRLITSIEKFTKLNNTTVFISIALIIKILTII